MTRIVSFGSRQKGADMCPAMPPDAMSKAEKRLGSCIDVLALLAYLPEDGFLRIGSLLIHLQRDINGIPACDDVVTAALRGLITSIQFYDIVRQKFEEAFKACRVMAKKMVGSPSEIYPEALTSFCFAQLQSVGSAREDFMSAVETVAKNLEVMAAASWPVSELGLSDGIGQSAKNVALYKMVNIVADEVISNLKGVIEDARPFIPAAAWEEIAASAGGAETHGDGAHAIRKDILPEAEDSLSDNVELF